MDKIDIAVFLGSSLFMSWIGDLSGVEMVVSQALWLGAFWIGKKLLDRWVPA
jgi:hypothetical protein